MINSYVLNDNREYSSIYLNLYTLIHSAVAFNTISRLTIDEASKFGCLDPIIDSDVLELYRSKKISLVSDIQEELLIEAFDDFIVSEFDDYILRGSEIADFSEDLYSLYLTELNKFFAYFDDEISYIDDLNKFFKNNVYNRVLVEKRSSFISYNVLNGRIEDQVFCRYFMGLPVERVKDIFSSSLSCFSKIYANDQLDFNDIKAIIFLFFKDYTKSGMELGFRLPDYYLNWIIANVFYQSNFNFCRSHEVQIVFLSKLFFYSDLLTEITSNVRSERYYEVYVDLISVDGEIPYEFKEIVGGGQDKNVRRIHRELTELCVETLTGNMDEKSDYLFNKLLTRSLKEVYCGFFVYLGPMVCPGMVIHDYDVYEVKRKYANIEIVNSTKKKRKKKRSAGRSVKKKKRVSLEDEKSTPYRHYEEESWYDVVYSDKLYNEFGYSGSIWTVRKK